MSLNLTFLERRAPRAVFIAVAVFALGAVAGAFIAQHRFDMQPCPWCILQRVIFLVIGLLALIGAAAPRALRGFTDRLVGVLMALAGLGGMASAVYQNQFAAKSASCALSLADRIVSGLHLDSAWPDMFEPRANCAEAAVRVLGIPFEFWSLALFAVFVAVAVKVLSYRS